MAAAAEEAVAVVDAAERDAVAAVAAAVEGVDAVPALELVGARLRLRRRRAAGEVYARARDRLGSDMGSDMQDRHLPINE